MIMRMKLALVVIVLLVVTENAQAQRKLTLAGLPCSSFLQAYGTDEFGSYSSVSVEIGNRDVGGRLGSTINIDEYILTECRLHEGFTVGEAAEQLFTDARARRLPPIPVGGATSDPKVEADWTAFERWLKQKGPMPRYSKPVTGPR
jgi:hypothetical protein